MDKRIDSICVVGGGSAGYLSALYLKKQFPEKVITLIESSAIPPIGVGEATTPLFVDFLHHSMGYDVQEFFREARPTLKLGIKFVWGEADGNYYNEPFDKLNVHDAIYHTGDYNKMSLVSLLMDDNKSPFIDTPTGPKAINLPRGFAYHIDNVRFLAYLRGKLATSGCVLVDARIDGFVLKDGEAGVAAVVADDGTRFAADLFVDCSGF